MKTFKLHLIRHGLTSGNLQGLYIGSGTDIPLCDEGRAQLAELKEQPVEVAVETVVDQAAIDKAREEAQVAVSIMQAKLDKARYEKERAEARQKNAEEALEQVRLQLEEQDRAEKKAALGADKDVAQFEVLFDQGKDLANKMRGMLLKARGREDQAAAQGMAKALRALAEAIGRCAE